MVTPSFFKFALGFIMILAISMTVFVVTNILGSKEAAVEQTTASGEMSNRSLDN